MSRVAGIDPNDAEPELRDVFTAQREKWGAPLGTHLVHARRPSIYRGIRAMWSGIEVSGLIDPKLRALLNRRVAMLNGCLF